MQEKRTKLIKVRVTDDEHLRLKNVCPGAELARWMREFCLSAEPVRPRPVPQVDPDFLRQLAGIGNNLNQIARKINSKNGWGPADRAHILTALAGIEQALADLEPPS